MKSLNYHFKKAFKKNPHAGACILFSEAVRNKGFSKDIIHRWFNKLVSENEYDPICKKDILKQLCEASLERLDEHRK